MTRKIMYLTVLVLASMMFGGCSTDVYLGAKGSAFYPDQLFDKAMGDPRRSSFSLPQESSGVSIGGHHKGFQTIGGE